MTERPESMPENNVVDLLLGQHQEIRRLFGEVQTSTGDARAAAFDRLRRLLAVHETAEEEVVHPFARREIDGGGTIIDARLTEENEAKAMLSELEDIGPDGAGFDQKLAELRTAVLDHAEHEEKDEFPYIAKEATEQQLKGMAGAVKAAQATAPTHPHPGVESPTANLVTGPFAAMMDRTRDVIKRAMGRQKG
jgi:hemerythrin superfamily protein